MVCIAQALTLNEVQQVAAKAHSRPATRGDQVRGVVLRRRIRTSKRSRALFSRQGCHTRCKGDEGKCGYARRDSSPGCHLITSGNDQIYSLHASRVKYGLYVAVLVAPRAE